MALGKLWVIFLNPHGGGAGGGGAPESIGERRWLAEERSHWSWRDSPLRSAYKLSYFIPQTIHQRKNYNKIEYWNFSNEKPWKSEISETLRKSPKMAEFQDSSFSSGEYQKNPDLFENSNRPEESEQLKKEKEMIYRYLSFI